jgi:Rad3-related DNA helicase
MSSSGTIRLSVRELVNFTLRSGDLDASFRSSVRAAEGTRLHQKLQKSRGEGYKSEVPLSITLVRSGFELLLEGRADGVFTRDGMTFVEEIKSTMKPPDSLGEDEQPLHWAQAKCYAYTLSVSGQTPVGIQLTYIHAETEAVLQFEKIFSAESLAAFMDDLILRYLHWIQWSSDWKILRNVSIQTLRFPYPAYRSGQRALAVHIYKTILSGGRMFVQAPTGTGKTMSTLFPAIKAMGLGHGDKLFYLTARTTAQAVAAEALSLLRTSGLRFKSVVLTAKDKICFLDKPSCRPEDCPYAKGHFDRVGDALSDALGHGDAFSRETIRQIAQVHTVCPFELALDLTMWSDAVLCDYNYVFDPRVSLKRFFDTESGEDYVFLIDEAHHLVDRAREMYSAALQKSDFLNLKKVLKTHAPKVSKAIGKVNTQFLALKKDAGENHHRAYDELPDPLILTLRRFEEAAQQCLAAESTPPLPEVNRETLLDLYFDVLSFIRISELYGPDYITYTETNQNDLIIKLFCLHPRRLLSESLAKGKTSVLFSATLHPMAYFREVSGGLKEDPCLRLPSPFPVENLGLYVYSPLSTRFKDRHQTAAQIARLMAIVAGKGKPGHYLAFFPSYDYLRLVLAHFESLSTGLETAVQESSMDDKQRSDFLLTFDQPPEKSRVVFAVLGGLFSEGIDLTGDRLSGVIVVGVGLPQLHYENDLLRNYYDHMDEDGYAFAYQFPGMNKVLQAAGRVIRTETDRGIVLLVDDRFTHTRYRKLFPPEWAHAQTLHTPEALSQALDQFW